jgi:hypothetical protein
MVSACSTCHQTGDTDSFQLVIPLTVQLDSQGTFVPCEARIVGYSAGRTSSRQLRDTTALRGLGYYPCVASGIARLRVEHTCPNLIFCRSGAHGASLYASVRRLTLRA